jgi:uncharacterized protein
MHKVSRNVSAPTGFGTEIIGIPEGTELELILRLESVVEGVLVSGTASGLAVGDCIRCLEQVRLPLDAPISELFADPDRAVEEEDGEVRELEDDLINLEPVVRDAVVLALPFQPVCREDCPGLCSECGALLVHDPGHRHDSVDPRWSALQGILADGVPSGQPAVGEPDDEKES